MKKAKKKAPQTHKKTAPKKAAPKKKPVKAVAKKKPALPLRSATAKQGAKPAKKAAPKPVKKAPVVAKPVKKPVPQKPVAKAVPVPKAPQRSVKAQANTAKLLRAGLKPLPKPLPSVVAEEKRPKELYSIEYAVGSSPDILFEFISTAAGLEKWFARKVNVHENLFTFIWDKDEQEQAKLIALKDREFARFQWLNKSEKRYFEFRIQIDDLTGEVGLIVSDFADNEQERESAQREWDLQIHNLQHALGSP